MMKVINAVTINVTTIVIATAAPVENSLSSDSSTAIATDVCAYVHNI